MNIKQGQGTAAVQESQPDPESLKNGRAMPRVREPRAASTTNGTCLEEMDSAFGQERAGACTDR